MVDGEVVRPINCFARNKAWPPVECDFEQVAAKMQVLNDRQNAKSDAAVEEAVRELRKLTGLDFGQRVLPVHYQVGVSGGNRHSIRISEPGPAWTSNFRGPISGLTETGILSAQGSPRFAVPTIESNKSQTDKRPKIAIAVKTQTRPTTSRPTLPAKYTQSPD